MTSLLEKAFAEASKLSQEEQDVLAQWILAEIESENRWDELFAKSGDMLSKLADDALAEFRRGETQELDPDNL